MRRKYRTSKCKLIQTLSENTQKLRMKASYICKHRGKRWPKKPLCSYSTYNQIRTLNLHQRNQPFPNPSRKDNEDKMTMWKASRTCQGND